MSKRVHPTSRDGADRYLVRRIIFIIPIVFLGLFNVHDITFRNNVGLEILLLPNKTIEEEAVTSFPIVDIISIGSLLKEQFQDAQERTFVSHAKVRNFFRVNELSDADTACFTELTTDQIKEVVTFCSADKGKSKIAKTFRKWLFKPKKQAGWLCAQKRPIDGLFYVLKQYSEGMVIPDYLFIIDDDTYINMDSLMNILMSDFPSEEPYVMTGCSFGFVPDFTFPYGGFGSFMNKASIERLLKPIDCSAIDENGELVDAFARLACWTLNNNWMGEKKFFRNGMTIGDLMYQFGNQQPFPDVANWEAGYCFHSDHALAYFINFYPITVPENKLPVAGQKNLDNFRKRYQYKPISNVTTGLYRQLGECQNLPDKCSIDHNVCHYIQPDQMDALFRAKEELADQARRTTESAN